MNLFHYSKTVIRTSCRIEKTQYPCDFGPGVYCAEDQRIALEQASIESNLGFCNCYELDTDGLTVLDLSGDSCHALNWVAMLVQNRQFNLKLPVAQAGADYLLQNYLPDISSVDIIRGYRADGVNFSFARDFLNNAITVRQLETALMNGKLGEEVVLRSEQAMSRLQFIEAIPVTEPKKYGQTRRRREELAKKRYFELEEACGSDHFIVNIMEEKTTNGIAYAREKEAEVKVCGIKPLPDYKLWLRFTTGETKIFDFQPLLNDAAFKPLSDFRVFNGVYLDYGVPVWDNGSIDISPQYLLEHSVSSQDIQKS